MYGNNVFMAETSRDLSFFDKALLTGLRLEGPGVHEFEGDFFIDKAVVRSIDFPHTAFTNGVSNHISIVYDSAAFKGNAFGGSFGCV